MKTHHAKLILCAFAASLFPAVASAQGPLFTQANDDANVHTAFDALTDGSYVNRAELTAGGVSVGDFNADGWMDMYLPAGGTGPEQLLINMGDGTFEDQAILWGVDRWIMAMGSAVGDINKDGYPDLYVVSHGEVAEGPHVGRNLLYLNMGPDENGQFHFQEIAEQAGVSFILENIVEGTGATFGDVDLDGNVDLVVTCWELHEFGTRIYINNGDNTFSDISLNALPDTGMMRCFTPKLIDLNGDRYPELLLTNDFHESRLYIHNGKNKQGEITFREVTDAAGITEDCNGMGATVNDFNGDGLLDWYMTNVYTPSNGCGNNLYICTGVDKTGMPTFMDTALEAGVDDGGWGWGTVSGDYDNDGDYDITAINGYSSWILEDTRMFVNDGTGNFVDVAVEAGLGLESKIHGHGMAQLDYDNDGDLDLVLVDQTGPTKFYRNDTDNGNHWLRMKLTTRHHPCLAPMGTGTRVTIYAGDSVQLQVLSSPNTHVSQSETMIHFGLGDHETVDRIVFEWADGRTTEMTDVPTNQIMDIVAYHPADLTRDANLDIFDILAVLDAFAAQDPAADFNHNGTIEPDDVLAFIAEFTSECN